MDPSNSQVLHLHAGEHAVLLLHGMGASILEVQRLAEHLHAAGLSAHAVDVQGMCHGSPPTGWESWLEQALNRLHWLKGEYATVSLAGISMGATLALAIAEQEDVDCLVLLAAALAYDGWAMPWYRFLLRLAPILPFSDRYSYRESEPYGVKNPEVRAMIKRALKNERVSEVGGEAIHIRQMTEGMRLISHVRRHIEDVDAPTLIMHAIEDEAVAVRNAEWACRHISSASKELIYLGDCYHMITMDNERETVMHETERFIKGTLNASLPQPAFDLPPLLSRELRRLLKSKE
jgi:carboxylesterase